MVDVVYWGIVRVRRVRRIRRRIVVYGRSIVGNGGWIVMIVYVWRDIGVVIGLWRIILLVILVEVEVFYVKLISYDDLRCVLMWFLVWY